VIEMLVPEIAILETVQHLSEDLEDHQEPFAKINRDRTKYGLAPIPDPDEGDGISAYEQRLRLTLQNMGARILPTADIGQAELTRRALSKVRPFDRSGRGFKDTLIWLTILAELKPGEESVLISRDSDFTAKDGSLWPELSQELSKRGLGGMRSFEHVGAMVGGLVAPLPELKNQLNERLSAEHVFADSVKLRVEEKLMGRRVGYGPGPAFYPAVVAHFDITNLDVTSVLPTIDSGRFYAEIRASGEVVGEYPSLSSEKTQPQILLGALVRLEATYVPDTGALDNLDVESFSTVGWTSEDGGWENP
jgi:hypothetical protein